MEKHGFSIHGGLTLIPMPGFENNAGIIKKHIEEMGTEVDIVMPIFGLRVNNEPYIQLGKDHIGGHDCIVLSSGPGTEQMLMRLQFLLSYLVGRRANRISALLNYLPLVRSDKDEGSLEFALTPIVIHYLMSAAYSQLNRIISVDLHAPQAVMASERPGVITEVSMARRLLRQAIIDGREIGKPIVIMFPDGGARDRFENVIGKIEEELGIEKLPVVNGRKKRKNDRESALVDLYGDTEQLEGAQVICFDDEVTTGGTMLNTARGMFKIFKIGRFWGGVVHGVICDVAPANFSAPECPCERLYVCNTIPIEPRKELEPLVNMGRLKIYRWEKESAEIIYHHHWNENVREMR